VKWIDEVLQIALEKVPEPISEAEFLDKDGAAKAAVDQAGDKNEPGRVSAH